MREAAQEIWRQARPLGLPNTPARKYLARRRITSWPMEAIRFHPQCPFGHDRAPAIIAPVNDCHNALVVGVWRIRLTLDGEKVNRLGLGPTKGNCSRLWWIEGDELAIAEGVENALAFTQDTGRPCWSALSAGNMGELILPDRFRRVVIVQDNDLPDHRGLRPGPDAAQRLANRLRSEGRHVRIVAAIGAKDANDVLIGASA